MRVVFLHPDLGIGGAERLVVDAAVALQSKGHDVKVVTNHYDNTHSFNETEQLDIQVKFSWFPRTMFGTMWALCAYIRMCLAALYVCMCIDCDVIFSDQVSASLFILRLFSRARLVFYCHHPDLLLTERQSAAKSFYRFFLDYIEEVTTGMAHVICVNSLYTAKVTRETFISLRDRELTVLYPTLNTSFFDNSEVAELRDIPKNAVHIFSSLNRFEVKKNVKLALEAFAELRAQLSPEEYSTCHLVIAGGYDRRNEENIAYYTQLVRYANDLEIDAQQITFLRSPSDQEKIALLKKSRGILYTPDKEHFGIVPIEAMYLGRPVIAVNSGGPMETVVNERTGFLVEQNATEFARCMARLVREDALQEIANVEGPRRVLSLFAFEAFATRLDKIVKGEPVA